MAEVAETPKFDLDRLAREIDKVFQEKYKKNTSSFESTTKQILDKRDSEFDKIVKEKKKVVREIFSDMREELIEEIRKGRTNIVLPDSKVVNIQHLDHPKLEDVVRSLNLTKKAMLVGPAGTGKTYMVSSIAERMKIPFYKYSCSRDSSVHDLIGYKQPKSETYLETTFLKAYEEGGIFLVDEYDAMSGDMALFFNGVADNSEFISVPHRDEKPRAKKHKDFYLVMCGNTWGKGSTDYSGRDFQDMALMDRFRFSRHHIGYHNELEKHLMKEIENGMQFVKSLRAEMEMVGSYLSTRNVEDISIVMLSGTSKEDVLEMILQDLTEGERDKIFGKMKPLLKKTSSNKEAQQDPPDSLGFGPIESDMLEQAWHHFSTSDTRITLESGTAGLSLADRFDAGADPY